MPKAVLLLLVAAIATAACNDSTAPGSRREVRRIYNIQVPARAANTDSIRIAFDYDRAACDSALTVETRPTFSDIRFVVTSYSTNQACPLDLPSVLVINIPVVYVVSIPHSAPFTARFTEPGAADSVRVVAAP